MTGDDARWARLESILNDSAELAGSGREAYLDAACAGDETLRAEVETLLDYAERIGDYTGARELFVEMIPLQEKTLGENHDDVACNMTGFGFLLLELDLILTARQSSHVTA